jgi:hypothetical protein
MTLLGFWWFGMNTIDVMRLCFQLQSNFPSWHTRLGSSVPLNRIKALHANAVSRFQSNSDSFKLAVVFGKLVND